ncbi:MAG: AAA family ATPase [Thalassococcus sp.]|uniref:AAA family ATPase n=1 Tax=Thalassococcus sp. TaxID=1928858 RepID=UPI001B1BC542|nr:AAA family ATPase [Thalassococcus sp.]MBO6868105.1 AAA family ATPase [Thalassococcus sp.]
MKLRSLTLENIRRFAGKTARLDGIGDGITVVSEANEFGKTTFFDALHALFFEKYSSSGKTIKSMQPPSGGGLRIAAEFEHDGALYRLEKRFLSKKGAALFDGATNRLIAQDGEAEAWVTRLLGEGDGGPAGLLWVRQGVLGLEAENASQGEKKKLADARRDLMSSVMGEIDAVTGGRRMDRIRKDCETDLRAITTPTGRPTGAWKQALEEQAALQDELETLTGQCSVLQSTLRERTQVEAELFRLNDPDARKRLADDLDAAQQEFGKAQAQEGKIAEAQQRVVICQMEQDRIARELAGFDDKTRQYDLAVSQLASLNAQIAEASEQERASKARLVEARQALDAGQAHIQKRRAAMDQALKHEKLKSAEQELARLNSVLKQAKEHVDAISQAESVLKATKATKADLTRAEGLARDILHAETVIAATAPSLKLTYLSDQRAMHDGLFVDQDGLVALHDGSEIEFPGVAKLVFSSGKDGSEQLRSTLERNRAELQAILDNCALSSVDELRSALQETTDAEAQKVTAKQVLNALAPDGIDAIHARVKELAALGQELEPDNGEGVTVDEARHVLRSSEDALNTLQVASSAAQTSYDQHRETVIRLGAERNVCQQNIDRFNHDLGDEAARSDLKSKMLSDLATARQKTNEATQTLEDLRKQSADILTVRANLQRSEAAMKAANDRRAALGLRQTDLNARIEAQAGQGIEEKRDETAERLERVSQRVQRFEDEAAALTKLLTVLDAMREQARETYFGPVQEELEPLLKILHGEAALQFDSDTVMPEVLTRNGDEERLDSLSGGTQEQIAILTRLAFARLFARQGRHVPVVLDDALVFSDDDRIIRMFTALNRVALDQQILVFTCRQMAFAQLGGHQPVIQIEDLH